MKSQAENRVKVLLSLPSSLDSRAPRASNLVSTESSQLRHLRGQSKRVGPREGRDLVSQWEENWSAKPLHTHRRPPPICLEGQAGEDRWLDGETSHCACLLELRSSDHTADKGSLQPALAAPL